MHFWHCDNGTQWTNFQLNDKMQMVISSAAASNSQMENKQNTAKQNQNKKWTNNGTS